MILFKVVSVYIIFFELYINLFAAPLSRSWGVSRKSNLNDLEVKKHETFFILIGLGIDDSALSFRYYLFTKIANYT